MSEEQSIIGIKKSLDIIEKGIDKYFVRGIIFLMIAIAFGSLSFFSFFELLKQFNIIFMSSLIAGSIATFCLAYEADAYFIESNECKERVSMMETAIWITKHWIKDEKLDSSFFKHVNVKKDDEYDKALLFLKRGSYMETSRE